jgi:hypothetical protein
MIGLGETIGLRSQLLVYLARRQPQGIEIGGEMTHHAIGTDQHQRPNAILRCAYRGDRVKADADRTGALIETVANVPLQPTPVAGERGGQFALVLKLIERFRPGGAVVAVAGVVLLLEAGKEVAPLVADGARVALVLCLQLFDIGGVGTLQKGGLRKSFVFRLAGHWPQIVSIRGNGWSRKRLAGGTLTPPKRLTRAAPT